jgi:hypothetical protein
VPTAVPEHTATDVAVPDRDHTDVAVTDGGRAEVLPGGRNGRSARTSSGSPAGTGAAALDRCQAVGRAEFAGRYWSRAPLLTRADEFTATGRDRGFADLLGLDDVDELLSRRGLRTPFLRMAKDGRLLPASRYTGGGGAGAEIADQVLDERVLGLFADGATLVLQALHRVWPPLVEFAARLGA